MASWDPPFPVDLDLIRPQDEEYWDRYAGAPKAFVSLETGQRLWRSRYGEVTSLRLIPRQDQSVAALETQLREQLPRRITPEMAGFRWLAVRQQGLEAADFTVQTVACPGLGHGIDPRGLQHGGAFLKAAFGGNTKER